MTRITEANYEKLSKKKHGIFALTGKYMGLTKAVSHECTNCKKIFLISPANVLTKETITCLTCSKKDVVKTKKPKSKFIAFLKAKFPNIKCLKYIDENRKAKLKCACGNVWSILPKEITKYKYGCVKCLRALSSKYPIDKLKEILRVKNSTLQIVSCDKTTGVVKVHCSACKHTWITKVMILIDHNLRCSACAKLKSNTQTVKINNKLVKVSRLEKTAIKYLIEEKRILSSKLNVFSMGTLIPITYNHKGVIKEYWPSIKIGRTIIEVKSVQSLTEDWEKNIAKAIATTSFTFKLLVVHEGQVYELPKTWISWKAEDVWIFLRSRTINGLRILSIDPGTSNFAWSVLEINRPFKVNLLATGMLVNTITSLTGDVKEQVKLFCNEIELIKDEFAITSMVVERFMSRGMGGTTIELVNIMLGCLLSKSPKGSFIVITAAQWKNEWNRYSDLKTFYDKVACTVHQVDAIGIGLYGAALLLDEKPFSTIIKLEKILIKQIAKS